MKIKWQPSTKCLRTVIQIKQKMSARILSVTNIYHQFDIMHSGKMSYNTPVVRQNYTDPKGRKLHIFKLQNLLHIVFCKKKEPKARAL